MLNLFHLVVHSNGRFVEKNVKIRPRNNNLKNIFTFGKFISYKNPTTKFKSRKT